MVPTKSSAIKLIDTVIPHLEGKITGAAMRVPTASVSMSRVPKDWTRALKEMADRSEVMEWIDGSLVSSDLRGWRKSLVLAAPEMRATGDQLCVFGW